MGTEVKNLSLTTSGQLPPQLVQLSELVSGVSDERAFVVDAKKNCQVYTKLIKNEFWKFTRTVLYH